MLDRIQKLCVTDENLQECPLQTQTAWTGKIFSVETSKVSCPDGSIAYRELARHHGGAAVAVIRDGKLCLVRQWRVSVGHLTLEIPAGKLEVGEDSAVCAARELKEETGLVATSLELLATSYGSIGFTDEHTMIYLAHGVHQSDATPDKGEFVDVVWLDIPEVLDAVKAGLIYDSKTIIAASMASQALRRRAQLKSAIYGLAIGDALGVPYEFCERGSFCCTGMVGHGTHDQETGTFSDDTSMTLATCDSIRACGLINITDMRERFCRWLYEGAYTPDGITFDVGNTTAVALRQGYGCDGEWDNGNGSLMRIAPLAFTAASDKDIRAVSAITHAHALSCNLCVSFVHILKRLAAGATAAEVAGEWKDKPAPASSGFVQHAYDAALWCLANTSSYRDCVLAAVNLGLDTDTTAAIAGALAGVLYGYDAIPVEWISALRAKDLIESCLF
ncbi:ADP-ribosylglycohydrolase family protein [Atopobium sp. oral taxon 810]|uniref:ADP-ribosylglycohydrolase family protein n=1 Tax=Atopobium sp. oral taxon 810 TaxID=712158 RepID=UPI000397B01E|nr:ADP-ribosylglycohydrolase family protein [Atopobium sp. oral taxon 810]ERI04652.1 hydrolase, NUDIX family [Atopobium sp. oral taxon 810 str. F0209]